jgi:tetratricopeptide (TPR) repeat protein
MSPRTRLLIVTAVTAPFVGLVSLLVYHLVSYTKGIDLYRRGTRELDAGHYDAAIASFDAATHKNLNATNMSLVYGNRGWAYVNKRMDDEAIRDFSESIRLDAEPMYALWDRALAYRRKGELEKALADYTTALARNPNLAEAYHSRGEIFEGRGDWSKAIADYGEAIRCEPANAQFIVDRGMAFAANNELDRAIANFDAAIGLNRTHAGAYIQRAAAYSRKGNPTKGLADVTEAIRKLPEARQLWYARAWIYLDRGAIEEGIADCNEALRLVPDYDLGYSTRARAELMARDWDSVLRDTAAALELTPTFSYAHYLRGRAFTAKGEFDEAISEFNVALQREPGFQWALIWRALNYSYRREYSRALQELRQTLERYPGSAIPHAGLAWFLATCPQSDYRDGPEAIEKGLKACDITYWQYGEAVDALSAAYAEVGDFDRASALTNLALALSGSSPKDRDFFHERLLAYQSHNSIRDVGPLPGNRNLIDEGVRAYARNDFDLALRCFNEVLPPNPGASIAATLFPFFDGAPDQKNHAPWAASERLPVTNAFYYRGLTYRRKRQWDSAIADFTTVLRREPASAPALRERGDTYCLKGETSLGLRDYDEVIRLTPDDALAHALRADTLLVTKHWNAAIEAATSAIQLDPRLAMAYDIRGQAYVHKKEYEQAARNFDEADRLEPNYVSGFLARAGLFRTQGDYDSALTEFREAARRHPRSANVLNALAWFLATCPEAAYRNGPEAVTQARLACELSRWNEPDYLDTLAAAYAEAGDFDQAIKYARQAVSLLGPLNVSRKEIEEHFALFQRKEVYHAELSD